MSDEHLTSSELEDRLEKDALYRQQRRDRELVARYGSCTVCGTPRDISTSTPSQMRIRCSANPYHEVGLP